MNTIEFIKQIINGPFGYVIIRVFGVLLLVIPLLLLCYTKTLSIKIEPFKRET